MKLPGRLIAMNFQPLGLGFPIHYVGNTAIKSSIKLKIILGDIDNSVP